jgi:hypothetical protein
MKKTILTLAITIAFSTISFGQIKVVPSGDLAIGQNYITNNWFKTEINGERKVGLGISTTHENNYAWAAVSKAFNPTTKHWIVSSGGYSNHNFWAETWGAVNAHQYFTLSDQRLKENLRPVDNSDAIINNINSYYYDFKKGFNGSEYYDSAKYTNRVGFLAQEVQELAPNLVNQLDEKGLLAVDYQSFIPILTQYVKNQNKRINDLEEALLICCASLQSVQPKETIETNDGQETIINEALKVEELIAKKSVQQLKVVPNPNKGSFEITSEIPIQPNQILITNLSGELVNDFSSIPVSSKSIQINLQGNRAGVYFVHLLENGNILESKKVVVLN